MYAYFVSRRALTRAALTAAILASNATGAFAQLDPLLNLKDGIWNWSTGGKINVIIAIDSSERMQRDASNVYYDPTTYAHSDPNLAVETLFGVPGLVNGNSYRRKIVNETDVTGTNTAESISAVPYTGVDSVAYAGFYDRTRLKVALNALRQGLIDNFDQRVARFGVVDMRHADRNASFALTSPTATEQVNLFGGAFSNNTETGTNPIYNMSRYVPSADNGSVANAIVNHTVNTFCCINGNPLDSGANGSPAIVPTMYAPWRSTANFAIAPMMNGSIRAAGNDRDGKVDSPLNKLLIDAKNEVIRTIAWDLSANYPCRNTIVILITGGGEGNTVAGAQATDPENTALGFRSVPVNNTSRMVPIYVIAIAPPANDVPRLKAIARNSYGQYFQIDANSSTATINGADSSWGPGINAKPTGYFSSPGTYVSYPVSDVVKAFNWALSDGVRTWTDLENPNSFPSHQMVQSEMQWVTPVVGTVRLTGRTSYPAGQPLANVDIVSPTSQTAIPQRSNVLISASNLIPGFEGKLRAFRQYQPVSTSNAGDPANYDPSNALGWKFVKDGTELWVSSLPAGNSRNIFTTDATGAMIAFNTANASTIKPFLNLWSGAADIDASVLINYIRNQPLGSIMSSMPAVMNPPSLDPPPDADYPGFVALQQDRRTIIFVGANDGMMHAFDARSGLELWAFIPFNLLPKLKALYEGESLSNFQYFVDSSPKLADVKVGNNWRTFLIFGQGGGGTFYTTLDVTLDPTGAPQPTDDTPATLLNYFSPTNRITLQWSFPSYQHFDYTYETQLHTPFTYIPNLNGVTDVTQGRRVYGELNNQATPDEKTVGYTWSDPAVGQIKNESSPFVAMVGSGFYPSELQGLVRGGTTAGTSFYMFKMEDGTLIQRRPLVTDGLKETQDDCTLGAYTGANNQHSVLTTCTYLKNAIQADPVAAGNGGDKFMGLALAADLDGKIWSFALDLDNANNPTMAAPVNIFPNKLQPGSVCYGPCTSLGAISPIFNGMSIIPFSGWNMYIIFVQGSDKLATWCMGLTTVNPQLKGCDTNSALTGSTYYYLVSFYDQPAGNDTLYKYTFRQLSNQEGERPVGSPAVAGYTIFIGTNQINMSQSCSGRTAFLYAFSLNATAAYDTNGNGRLDSNESPVLKSFAGVTTGAFTIDRHVAFGVNNNIELFGDPNGFNNGVGSAGIRMLSWREIR